MRRYVCTTCQKPFEHRGGPLRCPDCLRQHGLEPLDPPAAPRPSRTRRPGWRALIVASTAALLLAAALLWLRRGQDLPRPGELGVLPAATLSATLAQRGVPQPLRVDPFASDEALRAQARGVRDRAPQARAAALAAALAERLRGWQADPLAAHASALRLPPDLWRALAPTPAKAAAETAARPHALSYELAALLVSLLRAAELPALLGIATELEGEGVTPEIGGVGRYLAVVYPEGQLGQKPLLVFDPLRALPLPPWAGPGSDPQLNAKVTRFTPLDDTAAAAHLLALRGLRAVDDDPAAAYQLSEAALQAALAPDATLLLLRARVLAAAGGLQDALVAAGKALQLGKTASRLTTLAELQLARGGSPLQAQSLLEEALTLDKSYWPAHRLLASLRWGAAPDEARAHLQTALALAPDDPSLLVLAAIDQLDRDERQAAIASLERALAGKLDERVALLLYHTLRAAGLQERAAALRQRLLDQAKAPQELTKLLDLLDQEEPQGANSPPRAPPPAVTPGR